MEYAAALEWKQRHARETLTAIRHLGVDLILCTERISEVHTLLHLLPQPHQTTLSTGTC